MLFETKTGANETFVGTIWLNRQLIRKKELTAVPPKSEERRIMVLLPASGRFREQQLPAIEQQLFSNYSAFF